MRRLSGLRVVLCLGAACALAGCASSGGEGGGAAAAAQQAAAPPPGSALAQVNDSEFGLTASIWTSDPERGARLAEEAEAGTVFVNRCDYLDPGLAWTGVKDSGFGCSLSRQGFFSVTRPKSYHLRNPSA